MCDVDVIDRGLVIRDVVVELCSPGAGQLGETFEAEGYKEQSRLVNVVIILIHDRDFCVAAQRPAESVRDKRATRAGSQDNDAMAHDSPSRYVSLALSLRLPAWGGNRLPT